MVLPFFHNIFYTLIYKKKSLRILLRRYQIANKLELIFWITGLILLAFMNPGINTHYSFCIFKILGFDFCPGCGLGHSIAYLFHGDFRQSISAHPLGIFSLPVILHRIYQIIRLNIFSKTIKYPTCNSTTQLL